ncbi:MAG: GDSL-type esterase/lipase family protein [Ilumatobacter sp.]|uniref:GDSL-type esterase/lipase family protein n=1 Tax=Ilumatobacter sp. TaxID=1967498 RepID=UPI0039189132
MRRARRLRRTGRALVALAVVAPLAIAASASRSDTAVAATSIQISTPGPLGAVSVIGDSVLVGAGIVSPTLPDQLAARGWGPIRFRAAGSSTSGAFPVANEFRASYWIGLWKQQGWDPSHVIVNLGVNDSGFCGSSVGCAYDSIMHLVNAIGPGRQIWWPTITKPASSSRSAWNAALRRVETERSEFTVWDWEAEFATGGYRSSDQIHLDPNSYRRRSERMAEAFTESFTRAIRTGGDAALPSPVAPASTFVPLAPQRLIDTRVDAPGRLVGGETLRVDLDVDTDLDTDLDVDTVTAAALYVAAARPGQNGYLAAGPCDAPAGGATVNFVQGAAIGAPTIAAVGADGDVCIFASSDTDVVVDVQGVFTTGAHGLRLRPLDTPWRLADTRATGQVSELRIEVGPDADAVAVNIATARAGGGGFVRASSCDEPTEVANLNFAPGPAVSASAFVPVGVDGAICLSASRPVDLILDLTGILATSAELSFVPVAPTRSLDTRFGIGGWSPLHGGGQTIDIGVTPPSAKAVTGTITMVRPDATGFVTGYSCVGDPPTASVNAGAGRTAANSITTSVFAGRMCLFASSTMQTVFDTGGWWVTT